MKYFWNTFRESETQTKHKEVQRDSTRNIVQPEMTEMEAKRLILDALDEIVSADFKRFIWYLCNGVGSDIETISQAKLENADREKVVDCMVQKYSANAGTVAVQVLVNINRNDLANKLGLKLQEAGSCR